MWWVKFATSFYMFFFILFFFLFILFFCVKFLNSSKSYLIDLFLPWLFWMHSLSIYFYCFFILFFFIYIYCSFFFFFTSLSLISLESSFFFFYNFVLHIMFFVLFLLLCRCGKQVTIWWVSTPRTSFMGCKWTDYSHCTLLNAVRLLIVYPWEVTLSLVGGRRVSLVTDVDGNLHVTSIVILMKFVKYYFLYTDLICFSHT